MKLQLSARIKRKDGTIEERGIIGTVTVQNKTQPPQAVKEDRKDAK
ncbi:MAG TPA: hypothetical protein VNI57_01460 [Candidatus Saccharimonadales bacterium]|nr:hypothetical protein [Candidatus Saccharimonadales bacterium]